MWFTGYGVFAWLMGWEGWFAYEGCELHTLLVFSTFSHQIRAFGEEPAVSEIMSVPSISQV